MEAFKQHVTINFKWHPGTANTHALSTLWRRKLKRMLIAPRGGGEENTSIVFHPHFVGEIAKRDIEYVFEEIVTSSFWKNSILKMFSVHIKSQSPRFQIPQVWTVCSFEERLFSWQIVVHRRPNPRNEAAFSNISSALWTRPQYTCLSIVTSQTWRSDLLKLLTGRWSDKIKISGDITNCSCSLV